MPNSLTELNTFAATNVINGDDRPYSITWSANTASNVSISTTEDGAVTLTTGVDLVDAVSVPSGNITYNINLANVGANAVLTWPALPLGVASTQAGNVYAITGVFDGTTWNTAKNATLIFKDREANYSFTSNVVYPNVANTANFDSKSYTTNVTITSSHAELSNPSSFYWDEDTSVAITGYPQITDAYSTNDTYTIVITPNVAAAVTSLVTSTTIANSLNAGTKALTLSGTKSNVNIALGNITLNPAKDYVTTFNLNYSLTNPISNVNTQVNQTALIGVTENELSNPSSFTWDEDVPKVITGYPQIIDAYTGAGTYSIVITPNVAAAVLSMTTSSNVTNSFNSSTKAFTMSGTKTAVNTGLGNVTMTPYPDYITSFNLNYSLTNPISSLNTQVNQTALIGNTSADFTMTNAYNFAEDQATQLVYAVEDLDGTASSYTMLVGQTAGTNGVIIINGVNAGVGNVGNLTTSNVSTFNSGNVTFIPYADSTSNVALTVNVYKNNVSGNVNFAANQVATLSCTSTHNDYDLGGPFTENTKFAFGNIITDTDTNVSTYTINIQEQGVPGQPALGKWYIGNTLIGPANVAYTVTDTKANINGLGLQWLPGWENTQAEFVYSQSKNTTYFGNIVQANAVVVSKSQGTSVPGITNLTARTFSGQTTNLIFANSTPQISDGPDYGQSYQVVMNGTNGASAYGGFGNTGAAAINNILVGPSVPLILTGNAATINSLITTAVYAPIASRYSPAASGTYTFSFSRDGVPSTKSFANTISRTGDAALPIYTFNSSTTWTPDIVNEYYATGYDLLVVGGGGGGATFGALSGATYRSGGGGAGGNVKTANNQSFTANTVYTVTVGLGGNPGVTGNAVGNTGSPTYLANVASGNILVAEGGGGACIAQWGYGGFVGIYSGGDRGGGTVGVGPYYGGGGAGAGGNGSNASPTATFTVGDGGTGIASSISGNTIRYGGGGGGGAYFTGNIGTGGNGGGGGTNRATSAGENGLGGGGAGAGTAQGFEAGQGGSGVLIIKLRTV